MFKFLKKERQDLYEEEVSESDIVGQTMLVLRKQHNGSLKPSVKTTSAPGSPHYTAKFGVRAED